MSSTCSCKIPKGCQEDLIQTCKVKEKQHDIIYTSYVSFCNLAVYTAVKDLQKMNGKYIICMIINTTIVMTHAV